MIVMEETLTRISKCQSRRTLWTILLDYFHYRGVTMASYHSANPDGTSGDIYTDGFPKDWVCHYINANLIHIDPIPTLAAKLARPFHWHEIEEMVNDQPTYRAFLDKLAEAGIGDGLAFYVFGPGTRNAYVGLGFGVDYVEIAPERIFQMQCVAQAGHLQFCTLNDAAKPSTTLSPRETEVLHWVARGKSNSVIADILGVSTHTVDALLRRIYAKLNVTDRTTAAIRGIGAGLISVA